MRRAQSSVSPVLRRTHGDQDHGATRRLRTLPEGWLGYIITLVSALAILLAGWLAAVNLDRLLPSGKGVVTDGGARNRLDESWMQSARPARPLGVFPYDTLSGTGLAAVDKDAAIPAQWGVRNTLMLAAQIAGQWTYMPDGSRAVLVWYNQYDESDPDISRYLSLEDIVNKFSPDGEKPAASTLRPKATPLYDQSVVPPDAVLNDQGAPEMGLDDAQYAGMLGAQMPGLPSPDRWLVYRLPVAWFAEIGDEATQYVYVADAVYHPSRGLVHLFLHEPGQSFPSAFVEAGDEVSLLYIKSQAAAFLETLLKTKNRIKSEVLLDKKLAAPWSGGGNIRLAETAGLVSAEADACYFADNLCAVSFPCEGGGHIMVYVDAATMNIRGFSRLYAGQ